MQANNENERLVIEFFTTLGAGNLDAVREALHEEATWTPMVRGVPGAGKHVGRKGIVDEFLAPVRGLFKPGDPKVHMTSIASNGPLVMTESYGTGTLADGQRYENYYAWAIEIKDGKIFAIREYMDSFYVAGLFAKKEG
jgi:ketosteroid isomerase-like protein